MVKAPPPAPQDWEVIAYPHKVDGDTVDLEVRRPIGELSSFTIEAHGVIRCRLVHLDTPERGEPGHDEATEDLWSWLHAHTDPATGDPIFRVVTQGTDEFGRYLSDVYYTAPDGRHTLSDYMVRERLWSVWRG